MSASPRDPARRAGLAHDAERRRDGHDPEIPPLEDHDRLSRPEFERRYDAAPHVKKAELIEGVVHMPSPAKHKGHGRPHNLANGWICAYVGGTPGTDAGCESSTRLDLENEPQPDICLRILPECGGQTRDSEDDCIEGAPELVVEVASSSASIDLHAKLRAYRRNGVREYIVCRTRDGAVDWFCLRDGEFVRLERGPDGLLRSEMFPGLWLDEAALLRGDVPAVLRALEPGLASPEHAAFVSLLASRRGDR